MAFAKLPPTAIAGLAPHGLVIHRQPWFAFSDEETGAVARLEPAAGDQTVVGLDHTGRTDRLSTCQGADRGETRAGAQTLLLDPGLQVVGELLHQRDWALAVEGNVHGLSVRRF